MQAVKGERERPVVMAVLEALTGVLRTCGTLAVQPPERVNDLCIVLKTVLQKKVSGEGRLWGEEVSGPRRVDFQRLQVQLCSSHHHRRKERQESPHSLNCVFHRQPVRTPRRRKRMTMRTR